MSSASRRDSTPGQKVFSLQSVPAREGEPRKGVAQYAGFSLHAGIEVEDAQREKLERLTRYVSRPAVAEERLDLTAQGQVRYRLKTPYRDGTTHIVLEPLNFIARLAALVPPPRVRRAQGAKGCPASPSRYRLPRFLLAADPAAQVLGIAYRTPGTILKNARLTRASGRRVTEQSLSCRNNQSVSSMATVQMYVDLREAAIRLVPLLFLPLSAAFGQVSQEAGISVRIFEPLYFQEFDPLNALDMVNRLPGVSLQETTGGRGLSGVRSNLLINGKRLPPKGKPAQELLQQMPVKGIAMIELIDAGARLDLDMQGYPQLINIITGDNTSAFYEFVTEVEHAGKGAVDEENERRATLQGTGRFSLGPHQLTITGNARDGTNDSPVSLVNIDAANPVQRYASLSTADRTDKELKLDAIFGLPGDSSLTFNGQLTSESESASPDPLAALDMIREAADRDGEQLDFSAEYKRPMASKGELLVALVDATSTSSSNALFADAASSRSSISDSETGETAARLLVTNSPTERLTFRTNLSSAFNYIDGTFQIFLNGVPLTVSGSSSRVEEHRHALDSSVDWVLTPKWNLRGMLGLEQYDIRSRDASSGTQSNPKGEIAVTFRPQPRTTFTLSTARSVGQLAFSQFLASSNLSSEILSAGASALEPERQLTHTASYDRRFADRGVMEVSLSRTETANPVNTVALSDSLTISQNTSPSIVDILAASLELPLERFGMSDMIFSIGARFSDSEMIDPITGEVREVSSGGNGGGNDNRGNNNFNRGGGNFNAVGANFNGFIPKHLKQIGLRKDPGDGKWSWSITARDIVPTLNYSTRQVRDSTGEKRWNASTTFEPKSGLRFRVDIDGPREQTRVTDLYPRVRSTGLDPWFISDATTSRGVLASFSVEWRGSRYEVTGSLTSRSDVEVVESLTPFGEAIGTFAIAETARTPSAMVRFRVRN